MDYRNLVKRLQLPPGYAAPRELSYDDVRAHALTRADVHDDTAGINVSIDVIRQTRGGRWPTGPVTEEFNYVDAVWHECEFRDGSSFTYVLHDPAGRYLGCCYLYPLGGRTPLTAEILQHDVDVSWWVTSDAYRQGYYSKVYDALRHWTTTAFPFRNPYYSNAEIPGRSG